MSGEAINRSLPAFLHREARGWRRPHRRSVRVLIAQDFVMLDEIDAVDSQA